MVILDRLFLGSSSLMLWWLQGSFVWFAPSEARNDSTRNEATSMN